MANTIPLIPNKLVIETTNGSPFWRMRYKDGDGWVAKSTKKSTPEAAEEFAREQYAEIAVLQKHGYSKRIAHTVSDASKIYYQNLTDMLNAGTGKVTYKTYCGVIRKHIDPIAGQWDIRGITNEKMLEYDQAVAKNLGRQPAKGTINTHNIVWRQIFQIARDRKWVSTDDIPVLNIRDKGEKGNRRPEISLDEYKHFRRFLRTYHETSDRFATQYKRKLLREYCIVLMASGMRPGREILGLRWKHIKFTDGATAVELTNPIGKTGDRPIVPMNFIKPALRRLKKLTKRTEPEDYVFAMPDGEVATGMSPMVSKAMSAAGIRVDQLGKKRTAYSLRHTYATFLRKYRDFTYDELAENMGTSIQMLQRHYVHAKSTDRINRYATGKKKQTRSEKTVEEIHDLLTQKFTPEVVSFLLSAMSSEQFEDEVLLVQAFEIELRNWNQRAENEAETSTDHNLRYVFQAAQNRAEEFLHGETIW